MNNTFLSRYDCIYQSEMYKRDRERLVHPFTHERCSLLAHIFGELKLMWVNLAHIFGELKFKFTKVYGRGT